MTAAHESALRELVGRYWSLAFAEGREGRTHDTEDGAAAACLHEIETAIAALLAELAAKAGELLRAQNSLAAVRMGFDQQVARTESAEAELAGLREDALRYRWLKGGPFQPTRFPCAYALRNGSLDPIGWENLDAAIDAEWQGGSTTKDAP